MSNIKSWEKFNEMFDPMGSWNPKHPDNQIGKETPEVKETEVTIDGFKYLIKKADIDVSRFDYEGVCEDYEGTYVVIENYEEGDTKVREFDGTVYDDNNHSKYSSFDPDNHSDDIHARLSNGDECYIDELYTIIATNNSEGLVYYDYLRQNIVHEDLKGLYKEF